MSELLATDVMKVVRRFRLKNLVETGTGPHSSGLEVAANLGLHGYSCDIDPKYCSAARKTHPNFEIYNSDSLTFLANVLPRIAEPTFIWCDAHFANEKLNTKLPPWPLYEELKIIRKSRDSNRHVIWCDDMQHVLGDNPIKDEVVGIDRHEENGGRWRGDERSIQEYVAPFLDSHLCYIEGTILKMEPR